MATDPVNPVGDELPPNGPEYDGIEHLDHPPPAWWKGLFAGTVVFSVLYLQVFHLGAPGRSAVEQYDQALAENMRLQFAEIGELRPDEATLVRMMNDSRWVRVGESVYRTHCVSCHGIDGGGLVGPNLTDEHYKNTRTISDLLRVVQNGAAAGAMPPWRDKLHLNEQILVSAFVASLRGTTPSNPRGPEGNVIPPWPTEVAEPEAGSGPAAAPQADPAQPTAQAQPAS